MILEIIILGIIMTIVGAIFIYLRPLCDEDYVISWMTFIFGILITIGGIIGEELPQLCPC